MNFQEKAIFIWDTTVIEGGDPSLIIARLKAAGFEAVYLHWQNLDRWRAHFQPSLIAALKAAGIVVYGSAAVYGENPATEGHQAGAIVNEFNLAGFVFDAESTFDAKATAAQNAIDLLKAYQGLTARPSVWCWWPLIHSSDGSITYHPVAVLKAAMTVADYGMPMAYWSWGNTAADAVRYLNEVWKQWRAVTAKPLIAAGRAYSGDGGVPTYEAVKAFAARARALVAHAVTWWDMQHAVVLPDCWRALSELSGSGEGKIMMANAIGLYTETENWNNAGFDFIAGFAGKSWLDTPANLKAIDQHAQAEGKPLFAWYEFNVDFYSRMQYMAKDEFWPPVTQDEPLQKLILVMQNRNIAGVVIEVMDNANHDGKIEQPAYIAYASKVFVGRVADWLKAHKPGVKLIVASSNAFIAANAPDINNWIGGYNSCAVQKPAKPLYNSLPDPTDKPAYLDNRVTCEFWRYYEYGTSAGSPALLTYRMGDRASLWNWLGFTVGAPSQPPTDEPPVSDDDTTLADWQKSVEARLAALETFKNNVKGA